MWIKRPKDFQLNQLLDKLVTTIKVNDEIMLSKEFEFDKQLRALSKVKGSEEAKKAESTLKMKKFDEIRGQRISAVESLRDIIKEELKNLESQH